MQNSRNAKSGKFQNKLFIPINHVQGDSIVNRQTNRLYSFIYLEAFHFFASHIFSRAKFRRIPSSLIPIESELDSSVLEEPSKVDMDPSVPPQTVVVSVQTLSQLVETTSSGKEDEMSVGHVKLSP
jgi:hypothetical protein